MRFFKKKSKSNLVAIHVHISEPSGYTFRKWLELKNDLVPVDRFDYSRSISFRIELFLDSSGQLLTYHCHEGIHRREVGCEFFHDSQHFSFQKINDYFLLCMDDLSCDDVRVIGVAPIKPLMDILLDEKHQEGSFFKEKSKEIDLFSGDKSNYLSNIPSWKVLSKSDYRQSSISYQNKFSVIEFALQPTHGSMVPYDKPFT